MKNILLFLLMLSVIISCQNSKPDLREPGKNNVPYISGDSIPLSKKSFEVRDDSAFHFIAIPIEVYKTSLIVLVSEDMDYTMLIVNEIMSDSLTTRELDGLDGATFNKTGYPSIMWIPKIPENNEQYATVNHELMHVVFNVMDYADISLNEGSSESYTYLMGYLTKNLFSEFEDYKLYYKNNK